MKGGVCAQAPTMLAREDRQDRCSLIVDPRFSLAKRASGLHATDDRRSSRAGVWATGLRRSQTHPSGSAGTPHCAPGSAETRAQSGLRGALLQKPPVQGLRFGSRRHAELVAQAGSEPLVYP